LIETSKTGNVNEYDEGLNSESIQKYKIAAEIVNETLKVIVASIAVGSKILVSCQLGDDTITEKLKKVYGKGNIEKGIAFPTCISVNNCVGHFSPLPESEEVFKEGDLIKIDLAAHIDGYIAASAQSIVLKSNANEITGPLANVLSATFYASEIALKLLKVGGTNQEITEAIEKVAKTFNCKPVEGVLSHQMSRFVLDHTKVIINKPDLDQNVDLIHFEQGEVYCIDIVMSTAEGKTREEEKSTVYKKNTNTYNLKLKASRGLLGEVTRRFPTFPFSLRQLEDQKLRLGVVECVKHDLLDSFPILFEKDGGLVAQFKFTVLITGNGVQRITTNVLPANVKSEHQIDDPVLKALISDSASSAASSSSSKSKSKKKKKNAGQSSKEGEAEGEEEEKEKEKESEIKAEATVEGKGKGKEKEEKPLAENQ